MQSKFDRLSSTRLPEASQLRLAAFKRGSGQRGGGLTGRRNHPRQGLACAVQRETETSSMEKWPTDDPGRSGNPAASSGQSSAMTPLSQTRARRDASVKF
eukprot:2992330-Pleurochrysis_carterae.AAC.1